MNIKSKISKLSIIVIGDLMIDRYLYSTLDRISPESPNPIALVNKEKLYLGGAANVANIIRKFGTKTYCMSVIGNDYYGHKIKKLLHKKNISSFLIEDKNRKTTLKSRIVAINQNILRYDVEDNYHISIAQENDILSNLEIIIKKESNIGIIISDYNKGVITYNVSQGIINIARKYNIKTFVDPKPSNGNFHKYKGTYSITPNLSEANSICGLDPLKSPYDSLRSIKNIIKSKLTFITRSSKGIVCLDNNNNYYDVPTTERSVYDLSGAGDVVISCLAIFCSINISIKDAIIYANKAADLSITDFYKKEIELSDIINSDSYFDKVITVEKIKANGKNIVFTNGCFDILHAGHVDYLQKSKRLGDILIIGLNSDESIRRLKGVKRPINKFYYRAKVLSALKCVDYIIEFSSDNPYDLISKIKPNILVKGGDYNTDDIIGNDIVDKVVTIPIVNEVSTTSLINLCKI